MQRPYVRRYLRPNNMHEKSYGGNCKRKQTKFNMFNSHFLSSNPLYCLSYLAYFLIKVVKYFSFWS